MKYCSFFIYCVLHVILIYVIILGTVRMLGIIDFLILMFKTFCLKAGVDLFENLYIDLKGGTCQEVTLLPGI